MDISLKYRIIGQIIQSEDENILTQIKVLLDVPQRGLGKELAEEIKKAIRWPKRSWNREKVFCTRKW